MNWESLTSTSETDDDFPPNQNHSSRGVRVSRSGRSAGGGVPCSTMQNDMKRQIHQLEQEAYSSILRAFKAQSDAITWEKESLITELRKELRVSDEEHRTLLSKVNAEDIITQIRQWRQSGEHPSVLLSNAQSVHDPLPSPSVSASRKRQKLSQSMTSLTVGASLPTMHSQPVIPSVHPSTSVAKQGPVGGAKGKKTKPYLSSALIERDQPTRGGSIGAPPAIEGGRALIGKKVMTRWPEDNNFYEAVITNYDESQGLHSLSYDYNTEKESFELVNLKEIAPQDIRWIGEEPGFSSRTDQNGSIPANKTSRKGGYATTQNGFRTNGSDYVKILHTETLLKEVERVYGVSHPDSVEVEKAKKMLKTLQEHEQTLIDVLSRLADTSDGEDDDEGQLHHRRSQDKGQGYVASNRNQVSGYKDMGREGLDGDHHNGYDYDYGI